MKSKHFLTLLTALSILFSLSMSKSKHYFEGEIHYDLSFLPQKEGFSKESLENGLGSTMVMLFRDGEYLKKYYNAKGELLNTRYLDLKEQKSYSWSVDSDVMYWFDITKNDSPTVFTIQGQGEVLGHECTYVTSVTKINYGGFNYDAKAEYFYSNHLNTDRKWYKDFVESNINEIGSQLNCIILKSTSDLMNYQRIEEATKIIERKIGDEEFVFDKTRLPLKEL